jgi:hypothetical protein
MAAPLFCYFASRQSRKKPAAAQSPPQVKKFRLYKAKFKTQASRKDKPLARIEAASFLKLVKF